MKQDMDKIVFESRREIEAIEMALNTYTEEHPDESYAEEAQRLSELLEVMHMSW